MFIHRRVVDCKGKTKPFWLSAASAASLLPWCVPCLVLVQSGVALYRWVIMVIIVIHCYYVI